MYKKIAAGEVVERPLSAVKELVENSIDAGADVIKVELMDGGKRLIKITDNGHGFHPDDIETAFKNHSTSKLSNLEDFDSLFTLGFRGEALPSILEVSKIEICSSNNTDGVGVRCRFDDALLQEREEVAFSRGSSILVEDLFYNFPVRKKFLKADRTELKQIVSFLEPVSLVNFKIGLELVHNGKTVFAYKKARNLEERIYQVFGKEFLDTLREIDHDSDRYHVKGFVSKLNTGVSVKKHQYFYVNGRSVREKTLIAALNNTFSNYLEKYRYPVGILLFTIPPHEVDVNIHPMKLEIKFENSGFIYQFIKQAIDRSLAGSYDGSGGFSATGGGGNYPDQAPGGPGGPIRSGGFDRPAFGGGGGLRYHGDSQQTQADYEQTHLFSGNFLNEEDFILIGQYKNSYILVERNEELLIVDQHNAQERVNFDRLKKEYQAGGVTSITPLFPIIVNLSTSEVHQMEEKHDALEKLGFRIEALSGNSFDIKAFPQILEEKSIKDALLEILHLQERKDFEDELLAEVACKSAIKVNHKLYPDQMKTIVKNLFETSNPYFCPHKRPIIIDFSLEKIEKMLKRR